MYLASILYRIELFLFMVRRHTLFDADFLGEETSGTVAPIEMTEVSDSDESEKAAESGMNTSYTPASHATSILQPSQISSSAVLCYMLQASPVTPP